MIDGAIRLGKASMGALLLLSTACGTETNTGPVAPGPAPAPAPAPSLEPTSITVGFADESQRVREGNTATVRITWSVTGWDEPIPLKINVVPGGEDDYELADRCEVPVLRSCPLAHASSDDYELSTQGLEIPAGKATSGELVLEMATSTDILFAEGNETLLLAIQPPDIPMVHVGDVLKVVIEEAGARPCPGVLISGEPPVLTDATWGANSLREQRGEPPVKIIDEANIVLTLDFDSMASDVVLDWTGPYKSHDLRNAYLEQYVTDWSFESIPTGIRHTITFEWLGHLEAGFRFRSASGACPGEPEIVCTGDGCELRQ